MSRNEFDLREPRLPEGSEMLAAMRRGVVKALRDHKDEGCSVITWDRESRQIVEIPSDQIVIPEAVIERGRP